MDERKQRLHSLIDLARVSRGWSRAQLATALGRDPTKIYPDSGNPKADFIMKLAEVLEWPVGDVMETVWGRSAEEPATGTTVKYEDLYTQARAAHLAGQYQQMVDLSRQMYEVAASEERKAFACAMEYSGWDGLGRYMQGVEAARRGLAHTPITATTRNILRADLANAWYSLWDLTPALGTTEVLASWYESNPPAKAVDRKRPAFVYYVRGNTHRRLIALEPELKQAHCEAARRDLLKSAEMYSQLADELGDPSLAGIANTCRGGLIEIDVELGDRSPESAVAELMEGVTTLDQNPNKAIGDWRESYGWWAIFGSNVALRYLKGRALQTSMSTLLAKTLEIADGLNNWAMRERVFTLQFSLHRQLTESSGLDLPLTIDEEDRSLITATMGRFPVFRNVGWRILETARVVEANK